MAKKQDNSYDVDVLESIAQRVHYFAAQMVYMANRRKDKEKGDPKVGGHVSASTSALHILGALHLVVRSGFDILSNKPHASPADHSYNYLLDLLLKENKEKLSEEQAAEAMTNLRAFPQKEDEYTFQSYHSTYDPDFYNFLPSGTVGIPAVVAGYLAHAYTYTKTHGYEVPKAHFWSIIGDSEFREGSLFEAVPDLAERQVGNLTWIVDYNRQSLDGHRISNKEIMDGTDDTRIFKTMKANGWEVIEVRHGKLRQKLFEEKGGKDFKKFLEDDLPDYDLQVLLLIKDPKDVRKKLEEYSELKTFLGEVSDEDLKTAIHDLGGHDFEALIEAMEASKASKTRPSLIIVHTVKGWGLQMAAQQANHNSIPDTEEMKKVRDNLDIPESEPFQKFKGSSKEGKFLKKRGDELYKQIEEQEKLKERNQKQAKEHYEKYAGDNDTLDINLKMASYPHTQWMLGQLTSKLTRIANTPLDESKLAEKQKPLSDLEKSWHLPAQLMISMAPDVGTSTNLNPTMDGKIYGAEVTDDEETEYGVKDSKSPDLVPGEEDTDRFLRFEIAEANTMSCMGAYGKIRDTLGIPIMPLMTVYDFFVKRALDQFFYNLYWKSSFICVGTPSGVTLSPEGAQHGWKSDFQIPNQIVWEPFFCQELDWILCDSMRRHFTGDNEGRTGVHIRGVTRGAEQKDFLRLLKTQARFKKDISEHAKLSPKGVSVEGGKDESSFDCISEEDIFSQVRVDVLNGAYFLIDYRGYANYEPGDNVVNIFSMGSVTTEAIKASEELLERGIYANVIVVTSPELLVGLLGAQNDYHHLTQNLGMNGNLYLQPTMNGTPKSGELATFSGRRVPIVSVADGEMGLLDNLGSIVGVKQETLAVKKHSRCGRPKDIYEYHGLDSESVIQACGKVLSQTALEKVRISHTNLANLQGESGSRTDWRKLWKQ